MKTLHACLLVVWTVALGVAPSARVLAEDRLAVRPFPELSLAVSGPLAEEARAPEMTAAKLRSDLRRGRAFRAAGVGLLVGGLIAMVVGATAMRCDRKGTVNSTAIATGVVMAGLGLGFTLGGGIPLGRVSDAERERTRSSRWLIPLATGTMLSAAGVAMPLGIWELDSCENPWGSR